MNPIWYRALIAMAMIALLFGVLQWLQGRFNTSDEDKATRLVKTYRPKEGGRSIVEAILSENPGAREEEISWGTELLSSCLGHVRVTANVPAAQGYRSYSFDVDLVAQAVHPTDPSTVNVLRSLVVTASTATAAHSLTP